MQICKSANNNGQSMFEVVIAIFIIAMIVIGIVSLSTVSLSNSIFSRNKNLAGKYSQEAIEWLRSQREQNLSTFKINAVGVRCLNSLDLTAPPCQLIDNLFKRQVIFTVTTNPTIIKAEVVTSWDDSKGYHEAKSVTEFTDIREK